MSFQQDYIELLDKYNNNYINNFEKFKSNILNELTLNQIKLLINYLDQYSLKISELNTILKNMNNLFTYNTQEIIENELIIKMIPIMIFYKKLLEKKYSNIDSLD